MQTLKQNFENLKTRARESNDKVKEDSLHVTRNSFKLKKKESLADSKGRTYANLGRIRNEQLAHLSTMQAPSGYKFIKYKKKDKDSNKDMKNYMHKKSKLYVHQTSKMLYKDPANARN